MMVLFEIHQRFKGDLLNKLRVSLKLFGEKTSKAKCNSSSFFPCVSNFHASLFLAFITFTPIFDDKTDTKILTSLFKNIGPKNLDIWTFFHAMKTAENIKNKCRHLLDQN